MAAAGNPTVCFICEKGLEDGDTIIVKERGLRTLRESSVKRRDNRHLQLQGLQNVTVHVKCQKSYTKDKNIAAAIKSREKATTDRSSRSCEQFDFKVNCILCGKNASEEFLKSVIKKPIGSRDTVHRVETLHFKYTLVETAGKRDDAWAKAVTRRIAHINDLVAAEGRYHGSCAKIFFKSSSTSIRPPGRPEDENVTAAFEYACSYMERNREECQFTFKEIFEDFEGYIPNEKTLKNRLLGKYGEDIIVTARKNNESVICFRDTGYKILTENWYHCRKIDDQEERLRIVKAAADIIREDIRSTIYDTETYPPSDSFFDDAASDVPQSLNYFLGEVILKKKRAAENTWKKKCTSIAHAVVAAVRPRSFLSSVQIGLAAVLSRKYGSKALLNILSGLGYCASYDEARLFEISTIHHPQSNIVPQAFSQFVFDNADVNVNTIDGCNTFHAMGGIQCITPAPTISNGRRISRLKHIPTARVIGEFGQVALKSFHRTGNAGIADITIEDLDLKNPIESGVQLLPSDFAWLYGKSKGVPNITGWNGFMESLTMTENYSTSRIVCLPFVDSPPSNYDTIFTVLHTAWQKCKALKQQTCIVTFDQPLYIKARDIVAALNPASDLNNTIIRLGGFHLVMSFMGTIGYVMDGSGLQDLFSTAYALTSTEKMLTGHAYSRALRAHSLAQLALATLVFQRIDVTDDEHSAAADMLLAVSDIGLQHDDEKYGAMRKLDVEPFKSILQRFSNKLEELSQHGPTAKLWIQYFEMVTLLKRFVYAERSGNWQLHLDCIQKMLPYFHATGHFLYAKSCHLYLQDMFDLRSKLTPSEYDQFVNNGFFTVRRSDRFWSGIWSDMTIEQTLMRSMKSSGGLTHGRGITNSVLAQWILAMPVLFDINEQLESFCSIAFSTTEQHVDARCARISRDDADLRKFVEWLSTHDPFPRGQHIVSLSTGVVGDGQITCHMAYEIGTAAQKGITGNNFRDVKFLRKNRVMPLRAVNSKIKIRNTDIPVDPLVLFQRICLAKKSDAELKQYFQFELAPYPVALFDEAGMRKTQKSVFYKLFHPVTDEPTFKDLHHVLDGGYLLHRVIWHQTDTFADISAKYVNYVKRYFKNSVIIFDGYPDDPASRSTKSAERLRRSHNHDAANVFFDESMTAPMPQAKFLSNDANKRRLIDLLRDKFESEGIQTRQAPEDADVLIVTTALQLSRPDNSVIIVAEDIDILVILAARVPPSTKIYFMKPGKGSTKQQLFCTTSFNLPPCVQENILFLHAFSGCDTTSSFYRQGKMKFVTLLKSNEELQTAIKVFRDVKANPDEIDKAGQLVVARLYDNKTTGNTLNELRFHLFAKSLSKHRFTLASLPPTESAAREHCLRTYHQVQIWSGNNANPLDWGWKNSQYGLAPIPTTKDPAPQTLLNTVSCKCSKGCNTACGCRKTGLRCSRICINCMGQSCTNAAEEDNIDDCNGDIDVNLERPVTSDKCIDADDDGEIEAAIQTIKTASLHQNG